MVMLDIIEAILSRSAVDDLLRSKSVCKSWYSMITSPAFAKTHAKLTCKEEEEDEVEDKTRKIVMITSYIGKHGSVPEEWFSYHMWSIQGSCNGLVCLHSRGFQPRLCVTNPVTRVFRELEPPPRRIPEEMQCYGFGYDSCSDDYKVVIAIHQQGKALVQIFSLKSNHWRLFGYVDYVFDDIEFAHPGIFFNGALHWFWLHPDDVDTDNRENILLVSFDLAKEEFRVIPQPDDVRYVWNYGYSLGVIQGRLCIFPAFDEDDFPTCGIWVMKRYPPYSWELLPKDCEMKDRAIHYMLKDANEDRMTPPPTYFCDENIHFSKNKQHIRSPMFVQTLVSPYVNNNNDIPRHTKNNKSTANAGNAQERIIMQVCDMEDKENVNCLVEIKVWA